MAISIVAHTSAQGTQNGPVTTPAVTTTGVTTLVAAVSSISTGCRVSDSYGNTWSLRTAYALASSSIRLFYCDNPTIGVGHTFSTASSTGEYASLAVVALSGTANPSYDTENGATDSSLITTTIQPGSITPSAANAIAVSAVNFNATGATLSIDSPMSTVQEQQPTGGPSFQIGLAWVIQTTATAINPTWTNSTQPTATGPCACIASFLAAVGGATVRLLAALGCG